MMKPSAMALAEVSTLKKEIRSTDGVNESKELIERISAGDEQACRQFAEAYTNWVLYRVSELMKAHCRYSAREYICCLKLLQLQNRGIQINEVNKLQCDECMDSYIWFFQYLKGKLKAYKGINNCSLNTYVWSIINSDTMYVDWLRWKYGRVF